MMIFLIIISFILSNNLIYSQDNVLKTINGVIVDIQTNEPLPFSNISDNKKFTATSNSEGKFNFIIPNESNELVFSYIGYNTKSISLDETEDSEYLIIKLAPREILLQEVTVYASTRNMNDTLNVSALSLQSEKITKIANAMPDVLRSFQSLPSISTNNEYRAEFNVRGGNKDENLILVNNTQVYEPYHIKGYQNASVGIFNVDLIRKVNLITGGFSARYGDRLSSVANIVYREGSRESYKGAATLSMAFAEGYIEGPLFTNGSFIFGARKSYIEYLTELLDYGKTEIHNAEPSFYDFQGTISYNISNNSKFNLTFIHSVDNWKYKPDSDRTNSAYSKMYNNILSEFETESFNSEQQNGDYNSTLVDLQSLNIISNKSLLKLSISLFDQFEKENFDSKKTFSEVIYSDNNYFTNSSTMHLYDSKNKFKSIGIESEFDYQIDPYYDVKLGAEFKDLIITQFDQLNRVVDNSAYNLENPDTLFSEYITDLGHLTEIEEVKTSKYSAYMENIVQIGQSIMTNISGRLDYYHFNKELTLSPRINIAYSTKFGTTFRTAWGHYYQSPLNNQLLYNYPTKENTKSQKAIHYIAGIEQNIKISSENNSFVKFKVDFYYKDYKNLISSYYSHFDKLYYSGYNDAVGYAKGFDLYLVLNVSGIYSWLSYGYLEAFEDKLNDQKPKYPRRTSQKHTLAFVSDINLGLGWNASIKYYYGSGFPFAKKTLFNYSDTNEQVWETDKDITSYLPSYQRIDFRLSKLFIFKSLKIHSFIEVSNAFNHKNIIGYSYSFDAIGNPVIKEIALWPLLPSFGIKIEF